MFAKNPNNGRPKGQKWSGRKDRPLTMPSLARFDPDGQKAANKAAKMSNQRPKGKNCADSAKKRPVTSLYADVKSRYGTGILWTGPLRTNKRTMMDGDFARVPVTKNVGSRANTRNASCLSRYHGSDEDCETRDLDAPLEVSTPFEGGLPNVGADSGRNSQAQLDLVLSLGIARVQHCQSTVEVIETLAGAYRELVQRLSHAPATANASTQTRVPRLQREQMTFIYAGPWESCTHRQNRGIQTEDQDFKSTQQPDAVLVENSSRIKPNRVKNLFDWKSFGLLFVISAIFLGLLEILKPF